MDTEEQNLNRMYLAPTMRRQPTIKAIKEVLIQQKKYNNLNMYIDYHAHASKKGIFFFGNSLPDEQQIEAVLLAKLVSLNCINFDFNECNFSDKIMTKKDKDLGESRSTGKPVSLTATRSSATIKMEGN